jgi:hypothetical protein
MLTSAPIFCGREEFFEAYNALLRSGEQKIRPTVLGIHVAKNIPGFGRKRLLQELAGQALRDGHLPLLLTNERPAGTFAQNPLTLAVELVGAADHACRVLQIPPVEQSQILLLKNGGDVAALIQNPKLNLWVKREIETNGTVTTRAVKLALQVDLAQLANRFRASYPRPGHAPRIVVLLNRIEVFGEALTTSLLTEWADPSGFGTMEEPVPLIFTFALGGAADHIFRSWIGDAPARPWIIERALEPFAPGEDMLAYQRVFMNPFLLKLLPGVSDVALAISDDANSETVDLCETMFRLHGEGMPVALTSEKTFAIAKVALKHGYLVQMQDAQWFEEIFARR